MPPETRTIQILVDNDSWILPYAQQLQEQLVETGFSASLKRSAADLEPGWCVFLLGCTQLIGPELLSRNTHNLVVHESALPEGRGFAPMTWQILRGSSHIPVCLVEANLEVDAGDIWLTDEIVLDGTELCEEWRHKQGLKTIEMCLAFIKRYEQLTPQPQKGEPTSWRRRTAQDSELSPEKSLAEQFDLLRVTDNQRYPAYFSYRGRKYKLTIEYDD